jgi:hypothetical protein
VALKVKTNIAPSSTHTQLRGKGTGVTDRIMGEDCLSQRIWVAAI